MVAKPSPHCGRGLGDGRLHLTAIGKLAPHLTRENMDGLLERATHRSKRQIDELVAEIAPRPDVPVVVRKLPETRPRPAAGLFVDPKRGGDPTLGLGPDRTLRLRPDGVAAPESGVSRDDAAVVHDALHPSAPVMAANVSAVAILAPVPTRSPSVVQPLSAGRYKVQFTASAELRDKLERLAALMRPQVPDGDLAALIERAVTEKLERLEARRFATTAAPRKSLSDTDTSPASRHIPSAVRRAVRERDQDRCRFVDEQGRRCSERHRLEFHHRHPFGMGGDHSPGNISLLCVAHNRHLAERDYGQNTIRRHLPGGKTSCGTSRVV
jgi:hypothetical protein